MLYIDEKMSVVNNNSILKIEYLVYGSIPYIQYVLHYNTSFKKWLIVLAVADAGDIL